MDKILKFLAKLTKKEQTIILKIMHDIQKNMLEGYDCKKLINQKNLRRIRQGTIRVIFRKEQGHNVIITLDRRGNVYK